MYCCSWQRVTIPEILEDEWFKKGYKPPVFDEKYYTNLDDVDAVFKDSEVSSWYDLAGKSSKISIPLFFPFLCFVEKL